MRYLSDCFTPYVYLAVVSFPADSYCSIPSTPVRDHGKVDSETLLLSHAVLLSLRPRHILRLFVCGSLCPWPRLVVYTPAAHYIGNRTIV